MVFVALALACFGADVRFSPAYLPLQQGETAKLIAADAVGNLFVVSTLAGFVQVVKLDARRNVSATFRSTALGTPNGATVDALGNLLLAGTSNVGSAYVARIDSGLHKIVSTYSLGGESTRPGAYGTQGFAVAADLAGNVYVGGGTTALDFPITPGAFQTKPPSLGLSDRFQPTRFGFVTKLAPGLDRILYSTYVGGDRSICRPGAECHPIAATEVHALTVGGTGEVLAGGWTSANDLGVTAGTIGPTCYCATGHTAGWLSRFKPEASAGGWLTYITRTGFSDFAGSNSVDSIVEARDGGIVYGGLASKDFAWLGGDRYVYGGGGDSNFISKVDPSGKKLVFSTFAGERLGEPFADVPISLVITPDDHIWAQGQDFLLIDPTTLPLLGSFILEYLPDGSKSLGIITAHSTVFDSGLVMLPGGLIAALGSAGSVMVGSTGSGTVLTGVSSAARAKFSGSISPNELIGIYGGLFESTLGNDVPGEVVNGRYPTTLAGVQLTFDGVPAPVLIAGSFQIQTIVPSSVKPGSRPMVQITSPFANFSVRLNAVEAVPQVFLDSENLTTVGVAYAASAVDANGARVSRANPATPGQAVTIIATGLGDDGAGLDDGVIVKVKSSLSRLPVLILSLDDKQTVEVLYAGPAVGQVHGVSQIDFRMPVKACGNYCRFALQVGSAVSEPFGITVKP